jgi:outer membrane protein OmpA-like peptidoglycan-associated protein
MKKLILAISAASILALSGCETFDAFTGESKTSNTAKGAGIGASIGVALAYVNSRDKSSSDRKKSMLIGAGIGAIAGGSVGYYMDSQEAKLRKQLRSTGVSVEREGDNINLIMPSNITFKSGGYAMNNSFFEVMDSVVLVVQEFDKTIIVSAGHTDSWGSDSSNKLLSQRRAHAVSGYLQQKGVVQARLETIGFGEKQPVASNGTAEGRALNRRVEISLFPISEG